MAYTADKPPIASPSDVLRTTVAGWGVDLDPKIAPPCLRKTSTPELTGAHWDFPERQIPRYAREKTPEHKFLTPVFGTALSARRALGVIRRYAYRFSEGRVAHWVLLMFADRIDVIESRIKSFFSGRPDNIFAESGLKAEFTRHGLRSRLGQHRADVKHMPLDALWLLGTTVVTGAAIFALSNGIAHRIRRRGRRRFKQFI